MLSLSLTQWLKVGSWSNIHRFRMKIDMTPSSLDIIRCVCRWMTAGGEACGKSGWLALLDAAETGSSSALSTLRVGGNCFSTNAKTQFYLFIRTQSGTNRRRISRTITDKFLLHQDDRCFFTQRIRSSESLRCTTSRKTRWD
jgi:hypothetical protein